MVFDDKIMQEINKAYYVLDKKRAEIIHALSHRMWELESGWYNGHFHRKPNGDWERESYPIPVVTVRGLCDVEIGFEKITVTAKLKRRQALAYSFNKFTDFHFEAYGVENYLNGIAKMLGNRIAPPWCIGADQEVIVNEGNGLKKITLNSMIDREKKQIESDLSTQNVPKKYAAEKAKLQKEYETILKTMKPSIQLARSLNTLSGKTGEFKWGVMLENNFNTIKRKK